MQQFIYLLFCNELVGGAVVERAPFTREGYPVYSRLLVCPMCCQPWARLTVEGQPAHRPEMVACSFCTWYSERVPIPGSILAYSITADGVDWSLLDVLPEALLRREFNLTMRILGHAAPTL